MTEAAVAAQIHQTLDVDRHFATQVAFDGHRAHSFTDLFQISVGEVLDLLVERNTAARADLLCGRTANAVDRSQTDLSVLLRRNVDTSNTCHVRPLIRSCRAAISPGAACGADLYRSHAPRPCGG